LDTGAQLSADVMVSGTYKISYEDKSREIKSQASGWPGLTMDDASKEWKSQGEWPKSTIDDAVRIFVLFLKDDPSWKAVHQWEPPLKAPEPPSPAQLPSSIPIKVTGKKEGVVYLLRAGE